MSEILDLNQIVNKLRTVDILLENSILDKKARFLIKHANENAIDITGSEIDSEEDDITIESDSSIEGPRGFKTHKNLHKTSHDMKQLMR